MNKIKSLREEVNKIDQEILDLIIKRVKLAKKIGTLKKAAKLPVFDRDREQQVITKLIKPANKANLSPTFIRKLWDLLFEQSYKQQQ